MKVILKEDVRNLGKVGQIVNVADGYARNYLVPKGLAIVADTKNIKSIEHEKRILQEKERKIKETARELTTTLTSMTLVIKAKAGEEGKLFGSVTTMDIAEALKHQGIEVDKKKIILEEPIKRLGSYAVTVKLHPEATAQLSLEVIQE